MVVRSNGHLYGRQSWAWVRVAVNPLAWRRRPVGQLQHVANFGFGRAIEHRRCKWHAAGKFLRHVFDFGVDSCQVFLAAGAVVHLLQETTDFGGGLFLQHVADVLAQTLAGPAQVHFQHLTDVHTRGHAQRVQNDVHGVPSARIGHVFHRVILETTPLFPWRPAILSPGCRRRLTRDVDLDHLEHACGQLIALGRASALSSKARAEAVTGPPTRS